MTRKGVHRLTATPRDDKWLTQRHCEERFGFAQHRLRDAAIFSQQPPRSLPILLALGGIQFQS